MAPDGSRNHFYSSETVPMHMVQQPQRPGEAPMYMADRGHQQMNRGQQQQRQPEEQAMFERRPAPEPRYQEPQSKSIYQLLGFLESSINEIYFL